MVGIVFRTPKWVSQEIVHRPKGVEERGYGETPSSAAPRIDILCGDCRRQHLDMQPIALFIPSLEGGGAERAFIELANRFVAMGMKVDLVLVRAEGVYSAEVSPAVRIIALGGGRTLASVLKLSQYIRTRQPCVVMSGLDTANITNWLACWLAGVPNAAVLSQRSILSASWRLSYPRTGWIVIKLLGLVYRQARLVICNSACAAVDLQINLGVPPERSTVLHNSVDIAAVNELAAQPVSHEWTRLKSVPLILSVGSLTKGKDVPATLRALAGLRKVREVKLVVLGEGSERVMLEKLIRELGIQDSVQLVGFDRNPFRWMARAQVLVSSSLSEGCPNVILQALACGLQVVATKGLGGAAEILENGRWGRLVPVGDDQALAGAITETLDAPHPIDVRARAAMFDPDRTASAYLRLLLPGWEPEKGQGS